MRWGGRRRRAERSKRGSTRLTLESLETRWAPAVNLIPEPNVNLGHQPDNDTEVQIAVDPLDPAHLFAVSNTSVGLLASVSRDGGATWSARLIADGNDTLPPACCDGQLAWDSFGNLFLTYLGEDISGRSIRLLVSQDGGQSFRALAVVDPGPGGVDQPSVAVGPGDLPGTGSVWVSWDDAAGFVSARGARVLGLDQIDAFGRTERAPGSSGGQFGGIAAGPAGQVLVAYQVTPADSQGPAKIYVNLDADGLGAGAFGGAVLVTPTQVGTFRTILAQKERAVDAEANLAWDQSGARRGRVYLAYSDAPSATSDDLDVFVRSSDDNGGHWSQPVRVNDDGAGATQFLPSLAVDPATGDLGVAWYDTRGDVAKVQARLFAAVSGDGGKSFSPNVAVAVGASSAPDNFAKTADGNNYGDYTGAAFLAGNFYPAWADNSAALPGNTDRPAFDLAAARVHVADGKTGTHLVVLVPPGAAAGQDFSVTVVAFAADGSIDTDYRGSIHLSSTDQGAGTSVDYSFTAVDAGRHTFRVNILSTGDQTVTATDTGGAANPGTSPAIRVAVAPPPVPGRISGRVFFDYNGNGVSDPGEPGVPGRDVFLDANGNAIPDPGEPVAHTGADGGYAFTGLPNGDYTVVLDVPLAGTVQTNAEPSYAVAVLRRTDAQGQDFGIVVVSPLTFIATVAPLFPAVGDPLQAYVDGLYANVLAREGDADGVQGWVQRLKHGWSPARVADAFWHSAEHYGIEVDRFYSNYLLRDADPVSRTAWVKVMLAGMDETTVARAFFLSPEFQRKHRDNADFVAELYRGILAREPDARGLAAWAGVLRRGARRSAVVDAFLHGDESNRLLANGFYNVFLQRGADPAGLAGALARLWAGTTTRQLAISFLASQEYLAAAAAAAGQGTRDPDRRTGGDESTETRSHG